MLTLNPNWLKYIAAKQVDHSKSMIIDIVTNNLFTEVTFFSLVRPNSLKGFQSDRNLSGHDS